MAGRATKLHATLGVLCTLAFVAACTAGGSSAPSAHATSPTATPSVAGTFAAGPVAGLAAGATKIKHVVVIMQENRSFAGVEFVT